MSSSALAHPPATRDPEPFRLAPGLRLTAALLVVSPALQALENLTSPLDGRSSARDVRAIAAHQSAFELSITLGLLSTLLFAPAFVGLARACAWRTPRLATATAWTCLASLAGFTAVRYGQSVELSAARSAISPVAAGKMLDGGAASPVGATVLVFFLGGTLVGLVLLGVLAWRAGLPRPATILLGAFLLVDLAVPDHPERWALVSTAVLLAAMTWLALSLRRADPSRALPAPRAADAGLLPEAPVTPTA